MVKGGLQILLVNDSDCKSEPAGITGKQLLQQEPNTQTDEINISNLPQGLYQIHVLTEMGVVVKNLVKE